MPVPHDRLTRPSLIVVDMQNDFVRVGAPLEVPDARATIPAHRALLAAFRRREHRVIYTKFITWPSPVLLREMVAGMPAAQQVLLERPPALLPGRGAGARLHPR